VANIVRVEVALVGGSPMEKVWREGCG
jgi:hypothetical protein